MPDIKPIKDQQIALACRDFSAISPGPWRWRGNSDHSDLYLTAEPGMKIVMGFNRWGMQSAEPNFRDHRNILVQGRYLLRYEVAPDALGVEERHRNPAVYRVLS